MCVEIPGFFPEGFSGASILFRVSAIEHEDTAETEVGAAAVLPGLEAVLRRQILRFLPTAHDPPRRV